MIIFFGETIMYKKQFITVHKYISAVTWVNVFFLILTYILNSCESKKEIEIELKLINLESRVKELESRKDMIQNDHPEKQNSPIKKSKKLRYLYFNNAGLIGYFDDGTISTCPRCDFIKLNIDNLINGEVSGRYTVKNNRLIINNNREEKPTAQDNNGYSGWAMIDFKWIVLPIN